MFTSGHVKREQLPKRKSKGAIAHKDQRLCELELQHTILTTEIQSLQKIRRELEDSRNGFAALYKHAPIGYITFDLTGHIHDSNSAVSAMLGFPPEKLRGLPLSLLVYRDDLRRFLEHLLRCNSTDEQRLVTELRLQGKTKGIVPVQLVSVPFAVSGQKMYLTALVDLSERKQNEKALAEAKEFAESIVETIREPIAVLEADLKIVSVNRAFCQFFKKSEQLFKGQFLEVVLNIWWSGNRLRDELEKVLIKNQPIEDLTVEVKPHGLGERTLLLNARRLYQKANAPSFILLAFEDITDRKLAEVQLRTINEELERRVASRTEALQKSYQQMESFCYSIAHDLRAPLRSMKSFSDLLVEQCGSQINAEGMDYLSRIQQSAERMDLLIRDLLDYGQLNTINLPLQEIDLDKIVRDTLMQHEREISEKRAKVEVQDVLPRVLGHPIVLHVVLTNLISNALKFVEPGVAPQVTLWAEDKISYVRLWIQDNGIGIPPENRKTVFGVFQRLHPSDEYPGTGIGLALVHKGVERIGGRVGLESAPGKGSRFWIEVLKPDILKRQHPI
jgi:PAS domain S-box-containing protein